MIVGLVDAARPQVGVPTGGGGGEREGETEPAVRYKKRPGPLPGSDLCALTDYAKFICVRVYAVHRARRHAGQSNQTFKQ